MHTNYQPRKPGLMDLQIVREKTMARTGKDAFGYLYGARKGYRKCFLEAMKARQETDGICWVQGLAYSDRGDFTRCYRGGF